MKIIPTKHFLEHLLLLGVASKKIIKSKIFLIKQNPYRFKRLHGFPGHYFRVRFSDGRKEKRLVYTVKGTSVYLVCILDRDKEYKDLKRYLDSR